jgi:hypothetical protein
LDILKTHTHLDATLTEDFLLAEKRLAVLRGWTEIVRMGGSFLGNPPVGEPSCRGQAQIPQWTRDWRATGPLIGEYGIDLTRDGNYMLSTYSEGDPQCLGHQFDEFPTKDDTIRYAIVIAAITQLEAKLAIAESDSVSACAAMALNPG